MEKLHEDKLGNIWEIRRVMPAHSHPLWCLCVFGPYQGMVEAFNYAGLPLGLPLEDGQWITQSEETEESDRASQLQPE